MISYCRSRLHKYVLEWLTNKQAKLEPDRDVWSGDEHSTVDIDVEELQEDGNDEEESLNNVEVVGDADVAGAAGQPTLVDWMQSPWCSALFNYVCKKLGCENSIVVDSFIAASVCRIVFCLLKANLSFVLIVTCAGR